ncbi:cytochrome P450 [Artomyces pyxidatus]|uniref:Cytochrome P450 n=1 Tax=Artomyces pyxidatus TaxID=48021 RepID=A0ACB8SV40_9AGAM|nr:cytochrome P450 [Artomyces pyxidatus]
MDLQFPRSSRHTRTPTSPWIGIGRSDALDASAQIASMLMVLHNTALTLCAAGAALCIAAVLYRLRRKPGLPFFPGPQGLPILGNLFDLPTETEWVTYRNWGKEFDSDVVHAEVLGSHIVVINSAKVANELFEKRSSLYSDRPPLVALNKLLKVDWIMGFQPYGQMWRTYRKAIHEHFNIAAVQQYKPLQLKCTHQLLRTLLDSPEGFMDHIRHLGGQTILSIAYGIDVKPRNDPFVATAEETLHSVSLASRIDGSLFDMIPWLIRMPSWFPLARFKKVAEEREHFSVSMIEDPYTFVKKAMAQGTAAPSVASSMIGQLDSQSSDLEKLMSKTLPGNIYLGGADTTVAALQSFVLAMVLYPDARRKAQQELDTVIGRDRLPDFQDEESLPYVTALVKEVLRWRPVAPLGIPHSLVADDVYDGHLIPAGSMVFGNAWAMLHDPTIFPDPEAFKPEHFLGHASDLFPEVAFGFGRRVCPGQHMARTSVWIAVASVLAAFDISPAVDEYGREIKAEENYASGIVSYPAPFPCRITPRSPLARELIMATLHETS